MTQTAPEYHKIDFDAVTNIVELAEIFSTGPYKDNGRTTEQETYAGIIAQYENAPRNNYENAAMVLYIDRNEFFTEKRINLKSMWFDEDGNRVARPVRNTDGE